MHGGAAVVGRTSARTVALRSAAWVALAIGCGGDTGADGVDGVDGAATSGSTSDSTTSQTTVTSTSTSPSTSDPPDTGSVDGESTDTGDTTGPASCFDGLEPGEVVWRVETEGCGRIAIDTTGRAILAGEVTGDEQDWWVATYDADGSLLWDDSEVGPHDQWAGAVMVATSGAYVVAGADLTDEVGGGGQDIESWIRQYSVDGALEWALRFPNEEDWVVETVVSVGEDADGHRVLLTERQAASSVGVLRRISSAGDVIATSEIAWDTEPPGHSPFPTAGHVVPADPSELVVVGSFDAERWALRVSEAGEILWSERWPCTASCWLRDIAATPRGDFVIMGFVPDGEQKDDAWVASLGGDGTLGWETSWGLPGIFDRAGEVAVEADGTIVVVGTTWGTAAADQGWLRKLSPDGELIWETTLAPQDDSADLALGRVATGAACGGILVTGTEGEVPFLALIAP